jgi:crossover junction endodeoxyribonuclease RuvC
MLQQILHFTEAPQHYDATDALAVALCHYFQEKNPLATKGKKDAGWAAFIANNPGRIKTGK